MSRAKGDHILTTQAHPEFTGDFMSTVLRFTEDKIPVEARASAWESLEREVDGDIFGLWSTQLFKSGMRHA